MRPTSFINHAAFLFVLLVFGVVLIRAGVTMTPFLYDGFTVTIVAIFAIVFGIVNYVPKLVKDWKSK